MALTTWEGLKVAGGILNELGVKGEAFEDENPGESYKMSKSDVINMVVEVLKRIGVEVMD